MGSPLAEPDDVGLEVDELEDDEQQGEVIADDEEEELSVEDLEASANPDADEGEYEEDNENRLNVETAPVKADNRKKLTPEQVAALCVIAEAPKKGIASIHVRRVFRRTKDSKEGRRGSFIPMGEQIDELYLTGLIRNPIDSYGEPREKYIKISEAGIRAIKVYAASLKDLDPGILARLAPRFQRFAEKAKKVQIRVPRAKSLVG